MKTTRKSFLALGLALSLTLGLLPSAAAEEEVPSSNVGRQNYTIWAQSPTSHLYDSDSGLVRVEYTGADTVLVEEYDSQFALQNTFLLPMELPLWGGFFAGDTYNYLFFGQENPEEDDGIEVIRVVQYDKAWNRIGSAGLFGANTTRPFRAGSLQCDAYGGYLYVRTCHEMYRSEDGYNHQSNLTFCLREKDLTITDSLTGIANNSAGYVSHSFNQHILVDSNGTIIALDHGDAYPRALVLTQYKAKAGSDTFLTREGRYWNCANTLELVPFPGNAGQNTTGASVGGLVETSSGYLAAYSLDSENAEAPRTVYLSYIPKGSLSGAVPYVQTLSNPGASTPQIVAVSPERGYVLWNGVDGRSLYCVEYTADSTIASLIQGVAPLSDCRPIPYEDGVLWYVTEGGAPTFYFLNNQGVQSFPTEPEPTEPEPTEPEPTEPQPTEPQPTEPQPTEPQPTEPQPTEPQASFTDVSDNVWYAPYAVAAAQGGLMQGTGNGRFSPLRTLTIAEVVTLTARLHAQYNSLTVPPSAQDEVWYLASYRYCLDHALFTAQELPQSVLTSPATRFWMVDLLDRAVPEGEKEPVISDVTVPDLTIDQPYGKVVYRWYAAGITQGDQDGCFNGSSPITRAETAAILCRVVRLLPRLG